MSDEAVCPHDILIGEYCAECNFIWESTPASDEEECADERERFIARFYNAHMSVYVGPFTSKDAAMHYKPALDACAAGEVVLCEVFEMMEPRHFGPARSLVPHE